MKQEDGTKANVPSNAGGSKSEDDGTKMDVEAEESEDETIGKSDEEAEEKDKKSEDETNSKLDEEADEKSEVEDEIDSDGITLLSDGDIIPPVIDESSIVFLEEGQEIVPGSNIHITFSGYDVESELSPENTKIDISIEDRAWFITASAIEKTDEDKNEYKVSFTFETYWESGEYEIDSITIGDTEKNINKIDFDENSRPKFTVSELVNESVVIKSITLSKNEVVLNDETINDTISVEIVAEGDGKDDSKPFHLEFEYQDSYGSMEAGCADLTQMDVLEIHVGVKDEHQIDRVDVDVQHHLQNVGDTSKGINMEYNSELGCYVGTLSLSDMYATEWSIDRIYASDIYGNYDDSRDYSTFNFYIKDSQGNTSIPTFSYNVKFDGSEQTHPVETMRITTLEEMFPDGIPYSYEKEGFEFLGWYIDTNDDRYEKCVSETEEFVADGYDITIYPVYDKREITVSLSYMNQEGYNSWKEEKVIVDSNATYKELLDSIESLGIEHYDGLTLKGWESTYCREDELGSTIPKNVTSVSFEAKYEENPIYTYYKYYNANADIVSHSELLLFENDVTYNDVLKKLNHASDYVVVVGRDRTEEENKTEEESMPVEIVDEEAVMIEEEMKESGNDLIPVMIILIVVVAAAGIIFVKKNKK